MLKNAILLEGGFPQPVSDKVQLKPNKALGTLNISARPNQIYASNMQRLADIRTGFAYFDLIFNVLPKTTPFDSS